MSNPTTVTVNGIKHVTTKGKIVVEKVYVAEFQKEGTLTAQLRQEIVTVSTYPTKRVETSMQSNVFSMEDFGFSGQDFTNKEVRMAWIPIPVGTTVEQVQAKIAQLTGACIYKVMSNEPILDENQIYSINSGQRTKNDYANSQVIRFPKGNEKEGQLCLTSGGAVQYRRTFFWHEDRLDIDTRNANAECFMSPEIMAELQGIKALSDANMVQGQTLSLEGQSAAGIPADAKQVATVVL